jgi:hypothetical protein
MLYDFCLYKEELQWHTLSHELKEVKELSTTKKKKTD